jgi:HEAT repeat protein/class 3 adenylate cyclase
VFESFKIKKLFSKLMEAKNSDERAAFVKEIVGYGKVAFPYVLDAFRKRELTSINGREIMEALCDDSSMDDVIALMGEPYDEIRLIAKELIVGRWKTKAVPSLVKSLKSANTYLKNGAVELLCNLKNQTCVPDLVALFNDADEELKKNLIRIIGDTGGPAAAKLVMSALNDSSWSVRLWAVKMLGKMKDPLSVDPLLEKLQENEPQIKKYALDTLGLIGDKRAARGMILLIKDPDMIVRQKATDNLIKIADSDVVMDIISLMRDTDVNVRRCAVEVLNNIKDPRTADVLINSMKDSDWWVRQIATDALSEIKGKNIQRVFLAMLKNKDEHLRRCAVEFFNKVPDEAAFEPLVEVLGDEDWWVREKTISALGRLKDKRAIPHLAKMINDEDNKWIVPEALAEIGGSEVIDPLMEFLSDESNRVRIAAISALGKLKDKDTLPYIKELLNDPDEEVRNEASKVLKDLTGKVFKTGTGQPGETSTATASAMIPTKLPEGSILTEAVFVVDLCNSTDIANKYGDQFALDLTKTFTNIVLPIAKRERFQFRKSTGDGFLLTFAKVESAVRTAFDILSETAKHNAKADEAHTIKLRFAINFGETRIDAKSDRLGGATNMTFRVEGVKPGDLIPVEGGIQDKSTMPLVNRVFVTETAVDEALKVEGVTSRLLGLFELKGITGLHKVFELTRGK